MRLCMLFGFLGSGKTTLARRILEHQPGRPRMAVIVNEFGDVGIDGTILEGKAIDLIELTSGCLCCTLKGPLLSAVEEIEARKDAQYVIVEATGVAEPKEMIEMFADAKLQGRYDIGPLVTVVDAANFLQLREILGGFYTEQIEHSDIVVLNKIDISSTKKLQEVQQEVEQLSPEATIFFAERCDIEVDEVLDGAPSRLLADRIESDVSDTEGHDHARHPAVESFVLEAAGNAGRDGIKSFFAGLPVAVWRAKGFATVDGEPMLIQYTIGGLDLSPAKRPPHEHLVFIGRQMDREAILRRWQAVVEAPKEH